MLESSGKNTIIKKNSQNCRQIGRRVGSKEKVWLIAFIPVKELCLVDRFLIISGKKYVPGSLATLRGSLSLKGKFRERKITNYKGYSCCFENDSNIYNFRPEPSDFVT